MAITLEGNWAAGLAFDVHTLSSTYLGVDEQGRDHWDTQVALALGEKVDVPVFCHVLAKEAGSVELKNIADASARTEALRKQIKIHNAQHLEGLNVLLLDDLYRSGATLQVSTELLYKTGCRKVNVLTLTKTRSKR